MVPNDAVEKMWFIPGASRERFGISRRQDREWSQGRYARYKHIDYLYLLELTGAVRI